MHGDDKLELFPVLRDRGIWDSGQIYRASVCSEDGFKKVTIMSACATSTEYAQEGRRHGGWWVGSDLWFQGFQACDGRVTGHLSWMDEAVAHSQVFSWSFLPSKGFTNFIGQLSLLLSKSWPLHFQSTQQIILGRFYNHLQAWAGRNSVAVEHIARKCFIFILVMSSLLISYFYSLIIKILVESSLSFLALGQKFSILLTWFVALSLNVC